MVMKVKWTPALTKQLCDLYPTNSYRTIADKLGIPWKAVKCKASNLGLKHLPGYNRMSQSIKRLSSEKEKFIVDNYMKYTNHELAKLVGCAESTVQKIRRKFNITGKVNTGCFQKGIIPANKGKKMPPGWSTPAMKRTQFKKGNLPINTKSDGEISIRTNYKRETKYYYKRIAQGKWRELHRLLWQEHHGPIPKGFNVQFKDGNTLNCVIENLYLIPRNKQMLQNSIQRFSPEVKTAIRLVGKLKRKIKKYEEQD